MSVYDLVAYHDVTDWVKARDEYTNGYGLNASERAHSAIDAIYRAAQIEKRYEDRGMSDALFDATGHYILSRELARLAMDAVKVIDPAWHGAHSHKRTRAERYPHLFAEYVARAHNDATLR